MGNQQSLATQKERVKNAGKRVKGDGSCMSAVSSVCVCMCVCERKNRFCLFVLQLFELRELFIPCALCQLSDVLFVLLLRCDCSTEGMSKAQIGSVTKTAPFGRTAQKKGQIMPCSNKKNPLLGPCTEERHLKWDST